MNLNVRKNPESKVNLTNNEILGLVSHQIKLTGKIQKYNRLGVDGINSYRYDEALMYLHEAEKILEYAASCGKTIDRFLITTTLQNEACAYQRLWKIEKAADYMEALVQNHRASLGSHEDRSNSPNLLSNFISNRIDGIFYSLQYSAIYSQLGHHESSIAAVGEAMSMLKAVCEECGKYEKTTKGKISLLTEELLRAFDINGSRLGTLLNDTRNALNNPSILSKKQPASLKLINQFTINQVLQINTLTLAEAKQKNTIEEQTSTLGLVYKFLYLSICFFVLSTENRLALYKKSPKHQIFKIQYKKCKIYHLWAIRIVAGVISSQSEYLNHIIKSFQKNYSIDIYSELNQCLEVSSIELESYSSSSNLISTDATGPKHDKITHFFPNVNLINSSTLESVSKQKKKYNEKSNQEKFIKKRQRQKQIKSRSQDKSKTKLTNKSMTKQSQDKIKNKEKLKNQSKSQSKSKSRKKRQRDSCSQRCRNCTKNEFSRGKKIIRQISDQKNGNLILKFSKYNIPTSPSSAQITDEYFGQHSKNKSPMIPRKKGKKSGEKQCFFCSSKEKGKHITNGIKFPAKRK